MSEDAACSVGAKPPRPESGCCSDKVGWLSSAGMGYGPCDREAPQTQSALVWVLLANNPPSLPLEESRGDPTFGAGSPELWRSPSGICSSSECPVWTTLADLASGCPCQHGECVLIFISSKRNHVVNPTTSKSANLASNIPCTYASSAKGCLELGWNLQQRGMSEQQRLTWQCFLNQCEAVIVEVASPLHGWKPCAFHAIFRPVIVHPMRCRDKALLRTVLQFPLQTLSKHVHPMACSFATDYGASQNHKKRCDGKGAALGPAPSDMYSHLEEESDIKHSKICRFFCSMSCGMCDRFGPPSCDEA